MTLTDQDVARRVVAEKSLNLDDEAMLNDMLGLMHETYAVPEVWAVNCQDPDCTFCDSGASIPLGGILVEAPGEWDGETVLKKLSNRGHTCESGNQFTWFSRIDTSSRLLLADIQL